LSFDPQAPAVGAGHVSPGEPVRWLREADATRPFDSSVAGGKALEILGFQGDYVLARAGLVAGWLPRGRVVLESDTPQILVRTYRAKTQDQAAMAFQADAAALAVRGYYPTSQSWAAGQYGCGAFLLALLLCVLLVGILVFIYMILVKPDGTLTVTYELRAPALATQAAEPAAPAIAAPARATKRCPRCAEDVLAEAKFCRFCGHEFAAEADA